MSDIDDIKNDVILKLKTIKDLELPINIYDLGLFYKIDVEKENDLFEVFIEMTVINSRCASTKSFTDLIKQRVTSINKVQDCHIKFVFSPKWDVKMITEDGLESLRNSQKK